MENFVSLAGKITSEPMTSVVGKDDGAVACRFTLSVNRTWIDRTSKKEKSFISHYEVVCYRQLAANVMASCQVDDSVLVIGRLNTRKVGSVMTTEIIADRISLDLSEVPIPFD